MFACVKKKPTDMMKKICYHFYVSIFVMSSKNNCSLILYIFSLSLLYLG